MPDPATVYILDDDGDVCRSVAALAQSIGLAAERFTSVDEFLESFDACRPGCIVTDFHIGRIGGLDLVKRLAGDGRILPVVFLARDADVSLAVRAMQEGAVSLVAKPFREDDLMTAIQQALARDSERRRLFGRRMEARRRVESLTLDERRVLDLIVAGSANKVIAQRLHMGLRTVESRRRAIMEKLGARSLADLVRTVLESEERLD
jgi:two-component system response regulator FixJ